ncbi:MAG: hypothetical protein FD149_822 [Rhodospirillaceae bacterium]|nr:MAG: hypothetical protein FD149_822 [Rhodospirillaceae bacterium]
MTWVVSFETLTVAPPVRNGGFVIRERHNPALLERNVDGNGCWTLCLTGCSMIVFEGF